ncbi:hypothetical protein CRE_03419 [Caenorhabditis remanei]|uniref:Serpentine receptor class r-10 n=1 Tax=Caenorhabditis remanei TaxID=31234 RepID=E3NAM5_CAERE|nr:hypothetical protein CRE_03419 [Caenorhabditis remanei]
MTVSKYVPIGQHICFLIAILANSLLLYLIKIRAGTAFGRYRIMMICFSVYSIFYATVETLTLPVMHIHGSGILFYVNSFLKNDLLWGVVITSRFALFREILNNSVSVAYCACFAFCISTLATHFVFRYIAVCRSNKLYYFDGYKLYLWFLPPLVMFSVWATTIQFIYVPNPETRDFFRNMTREVYEENIDQIAYVGPVYYTWENGKRQFRLPDLLGSLVICNIIGLSFTTCIICAYKTYKKLNDFSTQMSNRTRALNKQLFWTLGLQTLLPCFTQYMPVGLLFILPLFEIEVGKVGNIVGVTCCLYPAMDPLIAIFMIDRFRNCVFRKDNQSKTRSGRVTALNSDMYSSNQ